MNFRFPATVLGGLALLLLLAPDRAHAEPPILASGPLPVRDRFVLDSGFLVFEPAGPQVLDSRRWSVTATVSMFNSWSQSDEVRAALEKRSARVPLTLEQLREIEPRGDGRGIFHADGQTRAVGFAFHRGLGRRWEIWLRGSAFDVSGGSTDGFVESFHGAFGFGQSARQFDVRDNYTAYVRTPDGREFYRSARSGPEIGDIAIGARRALGRKEGRWTHSLESAIELPTGSASSLAGSGSVDLGLRYLGELRLGRARLRGTFAVVRHGSNDAFSLDAETLPTLWVGYEHALGSRTSILLQASGSRSRHRGSDVFRLDDRIYLADLGLKRYWQGPGFFFMAISENFNQGSSTDFGMHFGWQREF